MSNWQSDQDNDVSGLSVLRSFTSYNLKDHHLCVAFFVEMFLSHTDDNVNFPPVGIKDPFSLYLFSSYPTKTT